MKANTKILEVRDMCFAIQGKSILHNVSFALNSNQFIALLGPNGAGKTTLLKCLNRLHTNSTGQIKLNNIKINQYSQKEIAKWISYVPQSNQCSIPFTVDEFLKMARYPYTDIFSRLTSNDYQAINQAFELTDTNSLRTRMISTLSGGEQQMVLIAAALAQETRILLLDEPTVFLDPQHEQAICKILKNIRQKKCLSIIMVTHDINLASLISDHIIALKQGEIHFSGSPDEIMHNNILEKIYQNTFLFVKHPQTDTPMIVPKVI